MKFRIIVSILIITLCIGAYMWVKQGSGTTADPSASDSGTSYSLD